MLTESVYQIECPCGLRYETPVVNIQCRCGKVLIIQWLEERKQATPQPINEPKKRSAA